MLFNRLMMLPVLLDPYIHYFRYYSSRKCAFARHLFLDLGSMREVAGTLGLWDLFLQACGTCPDFESADTSPRSSNRGVSLDV